MLELSFAVEGAEPVRHAVSPEVALKLAIGAQERTHVRGLWLACQLRIDVIHRTYDDAAEEKLFELFGERSRWRRTQQSLLWAQPALSVPAFEERTTAELHVPCAPDFERAITKYLGALADGAVPLLLLFSGTVFYEDENGGLKTAPVPRSAECRYALPLEVVKKTMAHHFPDRVPLLLEHALIDRLCGYKRETGAVSLDAALARLLDGAEPRP